MKKNRYMNVAVLLASFVAITLLIPSCSPTQDSNNSDEFADDRNDSDFGAQNLDDSNRDNANFDNDRQGKDAEFLINAAEINLEEIQLGKLAQEKGGTEEVKALGKMMEEAHSKSLIDLTALAKRKMITLPSSSTNDAQGTYDNLSEESGDDFDKAYADKMVSEHKDAIAAFEDASTDSEDMDIQNWARSSLPALRKHLEEAVDCQNNLMAYNSPQN